MWPDDFARYTDHSSDDRIFLFEAGVEDDQRNGGKMVVLRKLMTLDQARTELTKGMVLNLAVGQHGPDTVDRIGSILRRKRGPCVVYVQVQATRTGESQFRLGDDFRVNPAEVPVEELEMLLGSGNVVFTGR